MNAIDIARRLSEMGAVSDACRAYALVIHENSGKDPAAEREAAMLPFARECVHVPGP